MTEHDMNIFRKTACIGALALALSGEGCATIANTVTGPPVMAYNFCKDTCSYRKEFLTKYENSIFLHKVLEIAYYSIVVPGSIFVGLGLGIPIGTTSGIEADIWFFGNDKYPEGYNHLDMKSC